MRANNMDRCRGKKIPGCCREVAITLSIRGVLSFKVYLTFLTKALPVPVLQLKTGFH